MTSHHPLAPVANREERLHPELIAMDRYQGSDVLRSVLIQEVFLAQRVPFRYQCVALLPSPTRRRL